jgi:DNA polymerase III delta prime subunit
MYWTEKYRPYHLDDVAGNQQVIGELKKYAKLKVSDLPNLLFYGSPGVGKTSTAYAFCFDGNHAYKDINSAQLNGKNDMDEFVHTLGSVGAGISNFETTEGEDDYTEGMILIFDKAEMLTKQAQNVLEKALESRTDAKAIFIANDIGNFTEPMLSRFTAFKFDRLKDKEIEMLLLKIAEKENLRVPEGALRDIIRDADGIPRSAITALEKYWIITTH